MKVYHPYPQFSAGSASDGTGGGDTAERPDRFGDGHIDGSSERNKPESSGKEFSREIHSGERPERETSRRDAPEHTMSSGPDVGRSEGHRQDERTSRGENARGSSERPDRPLSSSAELSRKIEILFPPIQSRWDASGLVRCGFAQCNSSPSPEEQQTKSLEKALDRLKDAIVKGAGRILSGKGLSPLSIAKELFRVESTSPESIKADEQPIEHLKDIVIYNENKTAFEALDSIKANSFPDLKTPEELSRTRFEQRRDYDSYRHY